MSLQRGLLLCRGRRAVSAGRPVAQSFVFALIHAQRAVHERPFFELPHDLSRGEAYEVARDALLQLNVMTRRGIEPDALMYTSLISIMGRAGLEWQAYKLFSRMIEGGVRPLPETYIALRDATSKKRAKLRDDIQAKIEESVSSFPGELAQEELDRQRAEDRQCVRKFEDYMRGELPPPLPSSSHSDALLNRVSGAITSDTTAKQEEPQLPPSPTSSVPVTTMNIRNPTDVWTTAQRAEEIRGLPQKMAKGESAANLRVALERMHEEELRIYLSCNRQLRHGSKRTLIDRIVDNVSEHSIRDMLDRRAHYFRSVEQILANDLELVKSTLGSSPQASPKEEKTDRHAGESDRTMSKAETEGTASDTLLTPWGILRKPLKYREDRSMAAHGSYKALPGEDENGASFSSKTLLRLQKVQLTAPELLLIRHKAEVDDLDELPESLLRRYAYQFRLRWRRRDPLSLLNAIRWHATTFLVPNAERVEGAHTEADVAVGAAPPTPAIRLQREKDGLQETLENFEAFRIISQRTNNLQVVDDKEINLHLKRIRRDAARRDRKTEESLRRESNTLAAAGLAASAKSYTPPPDDELGGLEDSHVLGWADGKSAPKTAALESGEDYVEGDDGVKESVEQQGEQRRLGDSKPEVAPDELPPWELAQGEEEFNLSTGHFGDPDAGRFQELSDSTIRVLPSRAAQKQWSVDRNLLPADLKDVVERAELEQLRYRESVEQEYNRRRQYAKYRKWDNMIQRSAKKKEGGRDKEDGRIRPLPAKKRLAQLLRRGSQTQKVPAALKEKYNREL